MLVADIRRAVAEHYGLTDADIVGRNRRHSRPRQVAMYLARELTGQSYHVLARLFHRDHSTVIYAVSCCRKWMQQDDGELRRLTNQIRLKCTRFRFVNEKLSTSMATSCGPVDNSLLRVGTTDSMVFA